MQQRPTCTNVRIRSTRDAHKIFYAVQRRLLPMITRRLDADERLALRSGCVYAWEERGPHTEITGLGIERFTEGRRWSPSRVRDVRSHSVSSDYGCAYHGISRNSFSTTKSTRHLQTQVTLGNSIHINVFSCLTLDSI